MASQSRTTCTKYQSCNFQSMPLADLLAALFVEDANGCIHINTVAVTGDCATLTPALHCATGETWEDLLRKSIVLDDCGLPAISLFYSSVLN